MLINVPQYIDVEDKIVGPMTAKQLGWLALMGVTLLVLWNTLPKVGFFILGIPLGLLFLALAFYKPYGQPLGNFAIFGVMYFFKPKVYIWKRAPEISLGVKQIANIPIVSHTDKKLSNEEIRGLAGMLDSSGMQQGQNAVNLFKDEQNK